MNNNEVCTFCGNKTSHSDLLRFIYPLQIVWACPNCGNYLFDDVETWETISNECSDKKRIFACYLFNTKEEREHESFIGLPAIERVNKLKITVEKLESILSDSIIPKNTTQSLECLLLYLFDKSTFIGEQILCKSIIPQAVYAINDAEVSSMIDGLKSKGYVETFEAPHSKSPTVSVTVSGREKAEQLKELTSKNAVVKRQTGSLSKKFTSAYMAAQINTMYESIESKPHDAIGKAKELLEDCCKTILTEKGIIIEKNWEVPRLMGEACKVLKLAPDSVDNPAKACETIKTLLGHHAAIAHSIAELRNSYGSGHGKGDGFQGLSSRHARLTAGSAATAIQFMWETYEEQEGVK